MWWFIYPDPNPTAHPRQHTLAKTDQRHCSGRNMAMIIIMICKRWANRTKPIFVTEEVCLKRQSELSLPAFVENFQIADINCIVSSFLNSEHEFVGRTFFRLRTWTRSGQPFKTAIIRRFQGCFLDCQTCQGAHAYFQTTNTKCCQSVEIKFKGEIRGLYRPGATEYQVIVRICSGEATWFW